MNPNKLTNKAQEIFAALQTRASQLGHQELTPWHLLAELLAPADGLATTVLTKAAVEANRANVNLLWAAEYRKFYEPKLFTWADRLGLPVYVVSPELHHALGHPRAKRGYEQTWRELRDSPIRGMCTDFPVACRAELTKS